MNEKQHVDLFRKLILRRQLLAHAPRGALYVPFIGDGDIAAALYGGRTIYGADLDPARVKTASSRLGGRIIVADCDSWPFGDVTETFGLADFDSYSQPYPSFRAFWERANKADQVVLFFTDAQTTTAIRCGWWLKPDGSKQQLATLAEKRSVYNFYWARHILPWFTAYVAPWKVLLTRFYRRHNQFYWGAVVTRG